MKEGENDRQLKLREDDVGEEGIVKKKVRKRNKSKERWTIFWLLCLSILISLGFYLTSAESRVLRNDKQSQKSSSKSIEKIKEKKAKEKGGFFGSAVYEF